MNFDVLETTNVPVYCWRNGVTIEDEAIQQLKNMASRPFVYKHIAAMPDSHFGIGAPVGSVSAMMGAVVPALVGVDIGCGMIAARTNLTKNDLGAGDKQNPANSHLAKLRAEIERLVPMGRTNNGGRGDRGAWYTVPFAVQNAWEAELADGYQNVIREHPELDRGNSVNHLGTLGTGNHFIEIQYDQQDRVWIMLHSGSRGPGNRIGTYYIKKAKTLMEKWFITLPDKDLAYLPKGEKLYDDYNCALYWAQKFAFVNRQLMLQATLQAIRNIVTEHTNIEEQINTHHNYAEFEHHFGKDVLLTRKGAIHARKDELGIIPGSMGTRSYIVRGLGNPLSFDSCSHGAGRAMSRTKAKKLISLADHAKATEGVECRKDAEVIDESPAAYKDVDKVIEAERDLVEVVHTLKQGVVCKG